MNRDAARLVTALEELILAESLALRAGDVMRAGQAQGRAAPLIAALGEADRAGEIPEELRIRLRHVAERRQQNQICVAEIGARCRPELDRLRATRGRLNGLEPAYGERRRSSTFLARA